jgi:hypothetical protein
VYHSKEPYIDLPPSRTQNIVFPATPRTVLTGSTKFSIIPWSSAWYYQVHLGSTLLAKPLSAAKVVWPTKYKLSVPHTFGHIEIIGTKKKMRAFWRVQTTSNDTYQAKVNDVYFDLMIRRQLIFPFATATTRSTSMRAVKPSTGSCFFIKHIMQV